MHKTLAALFLAIAVIYLLLGDVWVAVAVAAGGAFLYFVGQKVEGER